MTRRVVRFALVGVLIAGGLGTTAFSWPWSKQQADTYRTQAVGLGTVSSTISTSGPLSSITALTLNFRTSNTLRALNVKVGDRVQAGQALAQLDTTDATSAVQIAQT